MIVASSHTSNRFRWVFCQLEVLRHCFPANLRRTLEELPKSLDETYKRILNEINNANWTHAYRLLQCLAVALRPLRVEELAEVLAFDLSTGGIPKLNTDWRWEDQEEAVLSACSSLVSVIIYRGSRIVQFSHFSVKEFLTSNRLASCMEEVSQFRIPIEPSHATLAQACLGVLLCLDDRTNEDNAKKIPLYRYAVQYWVGHARVGNVELQIKDAMDYFFDMNNPHFSAWARIHCPDDLLRVSMDEDRKTSPRPAGPLYFAAWRGFYGVVERFIIKDPQQVTQLGGLFGTPLHASVLGGHIEVSQLLVAHGADINSRCADNFTPLHVASAEGRLRIAKWLLDHGADVNSKEERGWTPLHFSADYGHLETCRILLERNAGVNSQNYKGSTSLHRASRGWRDDSANIVRLLLDYGADVRVRDLEGQTASEVARGPNREQIVQLLSQRTEE
jgi:ankyrin repeat protein